ncbi:methyltransferase domain-containing protein [Candidatus Woesearchaeota archaeon]|nr:methyltransferase domain-containing protein [Candidatus Woesearchaeota archaeon]
MTDETLATQKKDLSNQWKKIGEQLWLKYYKILFACKDTAAACFSGNKRTLHSNIKDELEKQRKAWNGAFYPFYQGYQKIGIHGLRLTEKRIKNYDLQKYLKSTDTVLDIGCNTGYIALEISSSITKVQGLEINPCLINVANLVKEHLKISNAEFSTSSFENFSSKKQYSVILSLASHETWDNKSTFTFNEYIEKVAKLCLPRGILVFETHDLRTEDVPRMLSVLQKDFELEVQKKLEKEHRLMPERMLFVMRKR